MIINFLKNLKDEFLPHRPGIDPENYRVGYVDDKLCVWNPDTNALMEYYYDDMPDKVWFDISEYYKVNDGEIQKDNYLINRSGILINNKLGKNLTLSTNEAYPMYNIVLRNTSTRTAHTKRIQVHIILAKIFIPNINTTDRLIVDHINRDKSDYRLENLRWASYKENVKNSSRKPWTGDYIYLASLDKDFHTIEFTLSEEELYNHKIFKKELLKNEFSQNPSGYKHYGYYWKRENNSVTKYLNKFNLSINDIDDSLWKSSISCPDFKIHPLGLIKNKYGNITIGNDRKYGQGNYLTINYQGKSYPVHCLVAEVFILRPESTEKQEVDHITTDKQDNRVSNLRYCNHTENMSNPLTIEKFATKVEADGIVYESIKSCSKHYNVSRTTIKNWALDENKPNFKLIK